MAPARVFIVSDSLTGNDNLKRCLEAEANVEIIGEEKDINQAGEQIQLLRPDIIISDDGSLVNGLLVKTIQLLRVRPGLKIIDLSLLQHEVVIYQSSQKMARDTQDLVMAIKGSFFLP